jgi:hypothetical protein
VARMTKKEKKIQEVLDRLDGVEIITDDDVIAEFGSWNVATATWKRALRFIGDELRLITKAGKPRSRWASNNIVRGKKAHACARRRYLQHKKLRAQSPALRRV